MADAGERLERWQHQLAAREIPEDLQPRSAEQAGPRVSGQRAGQQRQAPQGLGFERAWEVLSPPGSVLDVGSGAGGSSLPLAPRLTSLTAVDPDKSMLETLADAAREVGVAVFPVPGRWPEVAGLVAPADVVVCHHVLYGVTDLVPFVRKLSGHARRRVVVELTARHPQSGLDPMWERFHGLRQPEGPTADDAAQVLRGLGFHPRVETWTRPFGMTYPSFGDLVEVTRRKLRLPAARRREVAEALRESGVVPGVPQTLSLTPRELVTIWWDPAGGEGLEGR